MDEAANAPALSINSRREKCEDIVLVSYLSIRLKSKYAKFILPSVNMWTVRTFFPLLRRTLKSCGARFQWCHCRHATGSAGSFVVAISRGPVASFPFTSTDIVPPRFDV